MVVLESRVCIGIRQAASGEDHVTLIMTLRARFSLMMTPRESKIIILSIHLLIFFLKFLDLEFKI